MSLLRFTALRRLALLINAIAVGVLSFAGGSYLLGQNNGSSRLITFTSADGAFRLAFPSGQVLYQAANHKENSYLPVCRDTDIACIVYPAQRYKGTNFTAAALSISSVSDAQTADACFTFESLQTVTQPDGTRTEDTRVSDKHPSVVINGVEFKTGTTGDAGMGHFLNTDIYRTFHGSRCYDVNLNIAETNFENYDPGTVRKFTSQDEKRVRDALLKVLHSMTFIK